MESSNKFQTAGANLGDDQVNMSLIIVNIKEWLDTQPEAFESDQLFLDSVKALETKIWREAFQNLGVAFVAAPDEEYQGPCSDNPYPEEDIKAAQGDQVQKTPTPEEQQAEELKEKISDSIYKALETRQIAGADKLLAHIAALIRKLETLVGLKGIKYRMQLTQGKTEEGFPIPVEMDSKKAKEMLSQVFKQSKQIHATPETLMRWAVLEQMPIFLRANLLNLKELHEGQQEAQLKEKDAFWQQLVQSKACDPQNRVLFSITD